MTNDYRRFVIRHSAFVICPSSSTAWPLLAQQLGVLLRLDVVDQRHVLIGDLLYFVEAPAIVVFRDFVIFEELLELLIRLAPDQSHAVAPFLGVLVNELRQLLAALLGERGKR